MMSYSSSVVQYSNGKETFTSKKEKQVVNGEVKKYNLDYYINSKQVTPMEFKQLLEKKYKALPK
jgi:hypothetical protein